MPYRACELCGCRGLTIVPLNFGYEWQQDGDAGTGDELAGLTLYIHSASIGRKLDAVGCGKCVGCGVLDGDRL